MLKHMFNVAFMAVVMLAVMSILTGCGNRDLTYYNGDTSSENEAVAVAPTPTLRPNLRPPPTPPLPPRPLADLVSVSGVITGFDGPVSDDGTVL